MALKKRKLDTKVFTPVGEDEPIMETRIDSYNAYRRPLTPEEKKKLVTVSKNKSKKEEVKGMEESKSKYKSKK